MPVSTSTPIRFFKTGPQGPQGNDGGDGISVIVDPAVITRKRKDPLTTVTVHVRVMVGGVEHSPDNLGNLEHNGEVLSPNVFVGESNERDGMSYSKMLNASGYVLVFAENATFNGTLDFDFDFGGSTLHSSFQVVTTNEPMLRGPLKWEDCAPNFVFQAGGIGDDYLDTIVYGNQYYQCIETHRKYKSRTTSVQSGGLAFVYEWNLPTDTSLWKQSVRLPFVAADLLLAKMAYIEKLITSMLQTSEGRLGQRVVIQNGTICIYGADGVKAVEFGVNEKGEIVLSYFNPDGTVAWDLGPEGLQRRLTYQAAWSTPLYLNRLCGLSDYDEIALADKIKNVTSSTTYYCRHGAKDSNGDVVAGLDTLIDGKVFDTNGTLNSLNYAQHLIPDGWYVQSCPTSRLPYTGRRMANYDGSSNGYYDYYHCNDVYRYEGGVCVHQHPYVWDED